MYKYIKHYLLCNYFVKKPDRKKFCQASKAKNGDPGLTPIHSIV